MAQEMNQGMLEMEKRLEARDGTLMKTLREMQEAKSMQDFIQLFG